MNNQENSSKHFDHIMVITCFLVGPPILATMFYWAGAILWGHAALGMFAIYAILYWIYGIDHFKVGWLLDLKYGKNKSNNCSP